MDLRAWLVVATIAGFVITVGGLVAAYVGARREYRDAQKRIDKMGELAEAEKTDTNAIEERRKAALAADPSATKAIHETYSEERHERSAFWTAEYERYDLTRATYGNQVYLAAYESRRLLGLVLNSTRRDFLVAAFGLLVSTAASVGSLFLTN